MFDPNRQIVLKAGSTVVGIPEEQDAGGVSLFQNVPNPAGTTTLISYSIDRPMLVQLDVTDLMGIVLLSPARGMETAGRHEVAVDCSKLSAGPYLYKLTAGNIVKFRKLVIVK